jgi:uncharacterized heparinase superfamily protein
VTAPQPPLLGPRPIRPPRAPWLEAVGRVLGRQLAVESFGAPGYGLTLAYPKTSGFAAAPRDFRPADKAQGRAIQGGRFFYAAVSMDAPSPADPWSRPSPNRAFAVELHRFAWIPHLMALGAPGAKEALRLTLGWAQVFGRWSPFAWGREVLSRRVFNLACASRKLSQVATELETATLSDLLARQARHLLRLPDDKAWAAEHNTAAAVAGIALAGPAGDKLLARALPRLKRALAKSVLADGCHASRNPEATLELLLDLLTLDDALLQRGVEAPPELSRTIDRMTVALRLLTLADGRLACFQGGETATPTRVAAGRAHDDIQGVTPDQLPNGRYHRAQGQLLQVIVDGGGPARGAYGLSACAQPLALEVVCGKDRLITNSGWSEREPDRQGFRLTSAASTLTLAETSVLNPLQGRLARILGPRLEGAPFRVESRREEAEGAVWIDLAHDGWVPRYGLAHERRLYIDLIADELRGEDRLVPVPGAKPRQIAVPYTLRFQLHPEVKVSMAMDHKSVLLRGPSGRGWWFRNDAADVAVETGFHFDDGGQRNATQIVMRGTARTDKPTRLRWKLAPAGADGR